MLVVDRDNFMAWVDGVLLECENGNIKGVGDNPIHEKAVEAMERGETIGLAKGNRVISHMRVIDEAYTEYSV